MSRRKYNFTYENFCSPVVGFDITRSPGRTVYTIYCYDDSARTNVTVRPPESEAIRLSVNIDIIILYCFWQYPVYITVSIIYAKTTKIQIIHVINSFFFLNCSKSNLQKCYNIWRPLSSVLACPVFSPHYKHTTYWRIICVQRDRFCAFRFDIRVIIVKQIKLIIIE